jgi:hypothetical protein
MFQHPLTTIVIFIGTGIASYLSGMLIGEFVNYQRKTKYYRKVK